MATIRKQGTTGFVEYFGAIFNQNGLVGLEWLCTWSQSGSKRSVA